MLILATVFAGYKLAGKYGKAAVADNTAGSESKTGEGNTADTGKRPDGYQTALNMTPVNLVMVVNSETGRIENLLVEILRATDAKLDYLRLASEVSYTMSSSLYSELIVDNTELPQTVTLSELYRYYQNDKAFEAARRIVGELINFNILYYTAVEDTDFEKVMYIKDTASGMRGGFVMDRAEAVSAAFGTPGSVKGVLETVLEGAVTNWSVSDRLRYLDVYDALEEDGVTFTDTPVIEKNETCELDTAGTGAILYKILY